MATFIVDLDDFCEEIFHRMEAIQDGDKGHKVEFTAENKGECANKIAQRLKPFLIEQLTER